MQTGTETYFAVRHERRSARVKTRLPVAEYGKVVALSYPEKFFFLLCCLKGFSRSCRSNSCSRLCWGDLMPLAGCQLWGLRSQNLKMSLWVKVPQIPLPPTEALLKLPTWKLWIRRKVVGTVSQYTKKLDLDLFFILFRIFHSLISGLSRSSLDPDQSPNSSLDKFWFQIFVDSRFRFCQVF